MSVIRRTECPRCGRAYEPGDGSSCRGPWALNEHEPTTWATVEYVRADAYRGAVGAMRVAKAALERRMASDDALGLPFDEDMADAIKRLDVALGGQ